MKRDIHVGADLGAVVSSGPYENLRPHFVFDVTYLGVEKFPKEEFSRDLVDAITAQQVSYEKLYKQIEHVEAQAMQKAIEKFHKDIRWYTDPKTGERWPSVTSVIDFANPIEWFVDKTQLRGLASRGQVVDMVMQKFIEDKGTHWTAPEDIDEAIRHLSIMKDTGVEISGNLPAFVEKFNVKFVSGHCHVVNEKDKYGGEPDVICTFGDDPALVLADLKSFNPDAKGRMRTMKQCAAYAMAHETKVDKIAIIPVHGTNQQGYSKPIITDEIEKYYGMFLADRKVFFNTFGI